MPNDPVCASSDTYATDNGTYDAQCGFTGIFGGDVGIVMSYVNVGSWTDCADLCNIQGTSCKSVNYNYATSQCDLLNGTPNTVANDVYDYAMMAF